METIYSWRTLGGMVVVEESNDKIGPIETIYFWCLKQYREQGKKKLNFEEFRDDL